MSRFPMRGPTAGTFTPPPPAAGSQGEPPALWDAGMNPGLVPIAGRGGILPVAGDGTQPAQSCANKTVSTFRPTPNVWLVIDGSGSMAEPFSDRTRWDALREGLMDPMTGVVPQLEKLVRWGMVMYDGPGITQMLLPDGGPATGVPPADGACPRLAIVQPALNNYQPIAAMYPMLAPGGTTPTHKALAQVKSTLPATMPAPDTMVDPTYVVLATDGAPNDFCAGGGIFGGLTNPMPEVVSLTGQMFALGVPVYVISLAGMDQVLTAHLNDVARAGGTGRPPFLPTNKTELVQVFLDIIGPEVGCEVKLNGVGVMESVACKLGNVQLNGEKLECGDNGFMVKDAKTIEITGPACERFKKDTAARLTVDFPCEVFIPS